MSDKKRSDHLLHILAAKKAAAVAHIKGDSSHPRLRGTVKFYKLKEGVMVVAECKGLPIEPGSCTNRVHGFHIHSGGSCCGTTANPFAGADGHYNPEACPHPDHAGDMPPLFATGTGQAFGAFLSDRFTIRQIIGKTVVVHANADDFTSQPSGNAGAMIGCGVINPSNKKLHTP